MSHRGRVEFDSADQVPGSLARRSGVSGAPKRCCVRDVMSMLGSCLEIPYGALNAPMAPKTRGCFKPSRIAPQAPHRDASKSAPFSRGDCPISAVYVLDDVVDNEILILCLVIPILFMTSPTFSELGSVRLTSSFTRGRRSSPRPPGATRVRRRVGTPEVSTPHSL